MSLRVTHIPEVLNSEVELLSRGFPLAREWSLHLDVVEQIWERFGRATVAVRLKKKQTLSYVLLTTG